MKARLFTFRTSEHSSEMSRQQSANKKQKKVFSSLFIPKHEVPNAQVPRKNDVGLRTFGFMSERISETIYIFPGLLKQD